VPVDWLGRLRIYASLCAGEAGVAPPALI